MYARQDICHQQIYRLFGIDRRLSAAHFPNICYWQISVSSHSVFFTWPPQTSFLSHLLIGRCDIGVQLSFRSFVRSVVRLSDYPSINSCQGALLCSSDSWEYETLHCNYPWHTLQASTLTCALGLHFTLHWLCQNFTSSLENLRRV